MQARAAWAVLGLLLAATVLGAATFDRRQWPSLVGDEATYLMAAQSLAWDGDLTYERGDYDRFVAQWGQQPEGLILQRGDGGVLSYAKPAGYPLFIAPFVRAWPTRGAAIANALLLALAAVVAARSLSGIVGAAAPLWVAVWVFASVSFAYVWWAHSDLFMMCLAALGLALAYRQDQRGAAAAEGDDGARGIAGWRRWALVGALLGLVVVSRPLYVLLLLPAALAVPSAARRRGLLALAAGVLAVVLGSGLGGLLVRGAWSSYGGFRQSYYSHTGFPTGGTAAAEPTAPAPAERNNDSWIKRETFMMGFDARQTGWNVVYYLLGRDVGLLPYFLPLLLGVLAFAPGRGRWALVLAVLLPAALLFWVRPFNFYGGGGAIANRYFLPLYPALWFLAARPLGRWRSWAAPLLVAVAAATLLWPVWTAPRAYPIRDDGGYRHVSPLAERLLPYETTLSHLKPSGQEDFNHNGLWVKLLTPALRSEDGGSGVRLLSGRDGELLVGSPRPLAGLRFVLPHDERLAVRGASATTIPGRPRLNALWLPLRSPRAVHRMWWGDEPFYLYTVRLDAGEGDRTFRMTPVLPGDAPVG